MRVIPTKIHGVLDYVMALLLVGAPWLFDFASGGSETWISILIGMSTIVYSLLTNYELGISGKIPMKMHLAIDLVSGILLAVSPWLFRFGDNVYLPHLILGLTAVAAVLFSKTEPEHTPGSSIGNRGEALLARSEL